jgi:hypothetical protein
MTYVYTSRDLILVDLDGTVTDARWRDGMMSGEGGWDAYHAASIDDRPIHDMVVILNMMRDTDMLGPFTYVGITGRNEKWRQLTNDWLLKHCVMLDALLMRADDDFRPAAVMKEALLVKEFGDNWANRVLVMFEDTDKVIEAFAGRITVLKVLNRVIK